MAELFFKLMFLQKKKKQTTFYIILVRQRLTIRGLNFNKDLTLSPLKIVDSL